MVLRIYTYAYDIIWGHEAGKYSYTHICYVLVVRSAECMESEWYLKKADEKLKVFLTTYTKCSIYKQVSFWEIIHNQIHSSVLQNESYTPWSQIYNVYWFVLPSNAFTSPPLLLLLLNTRALIEHYIMVYFHTVP